MPLGEKKNEITLVPAALGVTDAAGKICRLTCLNLDAIQGALEKPNFQRASFNS